jgi:hypothetical protein
MRGRIVFTLILLGWPLAARAQPSPSPSPSRAEPAVRRWFELQQLTIYSRYRFIENNRQVTTSNQQQYKDSVRARFNFDPQKRYTLNAGYATGNNFTSSWNNLGLGNGTDFDRKNNYFKQLFGAAVPVKGLELQYGGLALNRGDADEWVTYDDDGYAAGERVTVRRPTELFLDEITVTRAGIGPLNQPNLFDRGRLLAHPNYTQVLGLKRFSTTTTASLEYNRQVGADLVRGAVTIRLPAGAPVSAIRYEQYHRFNLHAASGLGLWAERPVTKYVRVQGGYVSVDQFYGGWNADRMLSGRRFFVNATIPIRGPLSASLYATAALKEPYAVSIHRRFDAVVQYDLLNPLRKARIF